MRAILAVSRKTREACKEPSWTPKNTKEPAKDNEQTHPKNTEQPVKDPKEPTGLKYIQDSRTFG